MLAFEIVPTSIAQVEKLRIEARYRVPTFASRQGKRGPHYRIIDVVGRPDTSIHSSARKIIWRRGKPY